jgi:hypothetical protein
MALLGAGDIPLDAAREAGDDVLRHPQQGRPPRLQEVHAGSYMFFFLLKLRLQKYKGASY